MDPHLLQQHPQQPPQPPQLASQPSGGDQQQPPYLLTYLSQLQQRQQQQQQRGGEHTLQQQQAQPEAAHQGLHQGLPQSFLGGQHQQQAPHSPLHDTWSMQASHGSTNMLTSLASAHSESFPMPTRQPNDYPRSPFENPFTVGGPKSPPSLKPPSGGASVASDHEAHQDVFGMGAPSESASVTSDSVSRLATAVDKADAIVPPPPRNKERMPALSKPAISETSAVSTQDAPPRGASPFAQQAQQLMQEVSEPLQPESQSESQLHARQDSRDESMDLGHERQSETRLETASSKPSRKQRRKQAHQASGLKDELPSLPQLDKPVGAPLHNAPQVPFSQPHPTAGMRLAEML